MEQAKVYYTDFRTKAFGDGLPAKLQKLMRKAGEIQYMDGIFGASMFKVSGATDISPYVMDGKVTSGLLRRKTGQAGEPEEDAPDCTEAV